MPVGYPTSCSPQAWSAASPLLCLRTLLRLDPWIPYGKTWLCPNLPEGIGYLKVEGIPLAGSRVTIEVGDEVPGGVSVERAAPRDRGHPRAPAAVHRRLTGAGGAGRPTAPPGLTSPGSTHSSRWGDSAPMVVPAPWPGSTSVSAPNGPNSRSSIERMMVAKSASSNDVLPGPPGKSVSPVKSSGRPLDGEAHRPGVWPGVAMVAIRSRPTSSTDSSSRIWS